MSAARKQRMTVAAITRSSLNTCPPYTMRYPSPARETMYSPMMEPIQLMPTATLSMETKAGREDGRTSFTRICALFAPIDRRSSTLPSSAERKAESMCRMTRMTVTRMVMKTMARLPVPHQMMMSGPKAILGSALRTTM